MSMQGSGEGAAAAAGAGTSAPALPAVSIPGLSNILKPASPATGAAAASGGQSTGNPLIDLIVGGINKAGQQLIADLNYSLSLASYVDASTGSPADPNAAQALGAIIPLVTLVVNGPPAAPGSSGAAPVEPTTPHIVTDIEKARIIAQRFQDPKFKAAIAPLLVDLQDQAQNAVSKLSVGSVVAAVLGIGLPALPAVAAIA